MNCKNPRILTTDEIAYVVAHYQRTMTAHEVADYLKMDKKRLVRTASRLRGKGHDIAMTYDRENPRTKDLSRLAKRNPELAAKVRAERKRTAATGIARQIAREVPKNTKRSRGAIDYTANPGKMKVKDTSGAVMVRVNRQTEIAQRPGETNEETIDRYYRVFGKTA